MTEFRRVTFTKDELAEPQAVPPGVYQMTIVRFEEMTSKSSGNPGYKVTLRIDSAEIPNPAPVRVWLMEPTTTDDSEARARKGRRFKNFFAMFGRDIEAEIEGDVWTFEANPEEIVTLSGSGLLEQETNDNGDVFNNLVIRANA